MMTGIDSVSCAPVQRTILKNTIAEKFSASLRRRSRLWCSSTTSAKCAGASSPSMAAGAAAFRARSGHGSQICQLGQGRGGWVLGIDWHAGPIGLGYMLPRPSMETAGLDA
jgi:hypothetical protein